MLLPSINKAANPSLPLQKSMEQMGKVVWQIVTTITYSDP